MTFDCRTLDKKTFKLGMKIITEIYMNKVFELADIEDIKSIKYDEGSNSCNVILTKKNSRELSLKVPYIKEAFSILHDSYLNKDIDVIGELDILYYNKNVDDVYDIEDVFSYKKENK